MAVYECCRLFSLKKNLAAFHATRITDKKTAREASRSRHSRALFNHRQVDGYVEVFRYLGSSTKECSDPANTNAQQEQAMGLWHDLGSRSRPRFKTTVLKCDDKVSAIEFLSLIHI